MSSRSTAPVPRLCVCGRPEGHPWHRVPRPPPWWRRLLSLAWPRWTWGQTEEIHAYVDRNELAYTRESLRRLKRAIAKERRRAGLPG